MASSPDHKRVNDILLGPLERPALRWLAAHSPAWMTPDMLTAIGTLGAVITCVSYVLTNRNPIFLWLASAGLVINWYGDSLDGTLARYRDIQRPKYGFFVDHTVDAFNTMLIVLGLGLSPYVGFSVAAMALIGYYLMVIMVNSRTVVEGVFKISYGKFGPTELRAIIIIVNTLMVFLGAPRFTLPFGEATLYDFIVAAIAAALIAIFVVSTWRQAQELSKIDPPHKASRS